MSDTEEPQCEEEEQCEEQQEEEEEQQPEDEGAEQAPEDDWMEQRPIDMDAGEPLEKMRWSDLIGMSGEEAKGIIEGERPELNVEIVHEYNATKDHRMGRVRIFVNDDGEVVQDPCVG